MKKFFKASAGLIAISGAVSAYLFVNPMGDGFLPHWVFLIGCKKKEVLALSSSVCRYYLYWFNFNTLQISFKL